VNQQLAALANSQPSHIKAQFGHSQSALVTNHPQRLHAAKWVALLAGVEPESAETDRAAYALCGLWKLPVMAQIRHRPQMKKGLQHRNPFF